MTSREEARIDKAGGTSYTFVTEGIDAAIQQAKDAAGDRDVLIAGGLSIAQQALAGGLVDELSMHISPVLLGSGVRLFDHIGDSNIELRPSRVLHSPNVTHIRYDVVR